MASGKGLLHGFQRWTVDAQDQGIIVAHDVTSSITFTVAALRSRIFRFERTKRSAGDGRSVQRRIEWGSGRATLEAVTVAGSHALIEVTT